MFLRFFFVILFSIKCLERSCAVMSTPHPKLIEKLEPKLKIKNEIRKKN